MEDPLGLRAKLLWRARQDSVRCGATPEHSRSLKKTAYIENDSETAAPGEQNALAYVKKCFASLSKFMMVSNSHALVCAVSELRGGHKIPARGAAITDRNPTRTGKNTELTP